MTKRLLIADDDTVFLNILTLELERHESSFDVLTVEDGEHTISLISEHRPDLLILDLRMPNTDGFGVLKHLQEHHETIPVFVVSHFHDEEHKRRSEELGARQYIVKSEWKISELVREIQKHLA